MKHYTLGILFSETLEEVVLIEKKRPAWQKGKYNFPGGHIEDSELAIHCVQREFEEETNLSITLWSHIGAILNEDNYSVEIFTAICAYPECIKTLTDEPVHWRNINRLGSNCISNIYWLIPFARNFHKQGNADTLTFGTFNYKFLKS